MINSKALSAQFISIYKSHGLIYFIIFIIKALNNSYIKRYIRGSFSQKGEDLEIDRLLNNKRKGFYIDIGAHSPDLFNNTKRFYERGWKGVNVEPNPVLLNVFNEKRKRDLNLNLGIKNGIGVAKFYEFEADSLSTFSENEKNAKLKLGYKLKREHSIRVISLKSLIQKYCKNKIDFISVDTEGLDLEVLQSNDWKKYRPKLVCVETGEFKNMLKGVDSSKRNKIHDFMEINDYEEVYTNGLNSIYSDRKS